MNTNKILIAYFDDNQYLDDFMNSTYNNDGWFKDEITNLVEGGYFLDKWGVLENIQIDKNLIVKYIIDNKDNLKDKIREYFSGNSLIYEDAYSFNIESLDEKITELNGKNKDICEIWKISGEKMGWRNLSGEKFVRISGGQDLVDAIAPKNTQYNLYIYMKKKNSNSFEIKLSHHDSPMGEFYTAAHYIPQHKAGDIVNSEELGKIKIIEIDDIDAVEFDRVTENYGVKVIETGKEEIWETDNII